MSSLRCALPPCAALRPRSFPRPHPLSILVPLPPARRSAAYTGPSGHMIVLRMILYNISFVVSSHSQNHASAKFCPPVCRSAAVRLIPRLRIEQLTTTFTVAPAVTGIPLHIFTIFSWTLMQERGELQVQLCQKSFRHCAKIRHAMTGESALSKRIRCRKYKARRVLLEGEEERKRQEMLRRGPHLAQRKIPIQNMHPRSHRLICRLSRLLLARAADWCSSGSPFGDVCIAKAVASVWWMVFSYRSLRM
jgi:hypothetical protein